MQNFKSILNSFLVGTIVLISVSYFKLIDSDSSNNQTISRDMGKLVACDFEVFGIVQGVFFRKHTEKKAKELNVKGWCKNTRDDTVKGQLEGEVQPVEQMKEWLRTTGSPQSRIDKAVFSELKEINEYTFTGFGIRKT